jgi:hypothetical protein
MSDYGCAAMEAAARKTSRTLHLDQEKLFLEHIVRSEFKPIGGQGDGVMERKAEAQWGPLLEAFRAANSLLVERLSTKCGVPEDGLRREDTALQVAGLKGEVQKAEAGVQSWPPPAARRVWRCSRRTASHCPAGHRQGYRAFGSLWRVPLEMQRDTHLLQHALVDASLQLAARKQACISNTSWDLGIDICELHVSIADSQQQGGDATFLPIV